MKDNKKINEFLKSKELYENNREKIINCNNSKNITSELANIYSNLINLTTAFDLTDEKDFLSIINYIDKIFEIIRETFELKSDSFTDNMIYFKFIRDRINHPKYLNNSKYKKEPYQKYTQYTYMGFESIELTKLYYGFDKINPYLFEHEDEEFTLKLDNENGCTIHLTCPYSKIFNCLYDLIKYLINKL